MLRHCLVLLSLILVIHCDVTTIDPNDYATDTYDDDVNGTTESPVAPSRFRCVWGQTTRTANWIKTNRDYIVLAIGIVGNALSLFVNARKMLKHSPNYYMTVLALADMSTILVYSVRYLHRKETTSVYWGQAACKIVIFLSFYTRAFAVGVLVMMTVERTLIVLFPLKIQSKVSVKNTVVVLACVALFFFCFEAPLFQWGLEVNYRGIVQCGIEKPHWWSVFELVTTIFVPMVILFLCNIVIIVRMKTVADKQEEMTNDTSKKSRARKQFMQITIQTLTVSISFVVLTMFLFVHYLPESPTVYPHYEKFSDPDTLLRCWFHEFSYLYAEMADFLYLLNHAINGYLYCLFSRMFRKELVHNVQAIFCPGRLKKAQTSNITMTSVTSMPKSVSTVS